MPSNTLGTFYRPQSPTMNAGGAPRQLAPTMRPAISSMARPASPRPPQMGGMYSSAGGRPPTMGFAGGGVPRPAGPQFNTGLRAAPRPAAPRAPAPRQQMMGANMGAAMMSDERSKKRIAELEDLNDQYASLLDGPAATADVKPKAPPTADLDRSNARALGEAGSYSYEYKDPKAPGAASGRQAGPMAQELEGIPGVVGAGPDGFKRVDTGRLALATASATGDQERRLRTLEDDISALSDQGSFTDEEARLYRELAEGEQRSLDQIRRASSHGAFGDEEMRQLRAKGVR